METKWPDDALKWGNKEDIDIFETLLLWRCDIDCMSVDHHMRRKIKIVCNLARDSLIIVQGKTNA